MLNEELDLWYYKIFSKVWNSFSRKTELQNLKLSESIAKQFSGLKVSEDQVKDAIRKANLGDKPTQWSEEEVKKFCGVLRNISKPMIIAANKIDLENGSENWGRVKKEMPELIIIPCSADSELALRQAAKAEMIYYIPGDKEFKELKELNEKQKRALDKKRNGVLKKYGSTGVQDVLNKVVFELLGYIAIFPASATKHADSKGNVLPDCFLLPPGSTALDFAYFLHTDFGKNFIKAIDARTKKAVGKDYKLKHRDGLEILTR